MALMWNSSFFRVQSFVILLQIILTFHVPNTLVSLSPLPLLVPFHFEISLAFFLVQPFDYSIGLVPAVEHFDAGKSELCCQQSLPLTRHLLCGDLTELFHELPDIHGLQNNMSQKNYVE